MTDVLLIVVGAVAALLFVVGVVFSLRDMQARKAEASLGSSQSTSSRASTKETIENARKEARAKSRDEKIPLFERLQVWIDQSGVKISPLVFAAMTCCAGIVPALVLILLLSNWLGAVLSYLAFATIPWMYIKFKKAQRSNRLREQLPDALDLMSRMLRAGQTIPQSMRGVADEFPSPISDEFGSCYEQQNLGLSTDAAMYEMARRTGVLELRILVVALTIHRQTGGNLSELLDNLSAVMRDRFRILGQIKALTADGRMQAAILLALPPFMLCLLSVLNAEYITILFQFPWLLGVMFGFELLGALWLRQIVNFDF